MPPAGSTRATKRGALVVIRDHINLQGQNPLVGPNEERFGPRFPDMTDAYNPQFRKFALDEAERLDGDISEGVYAAMLGPSYETPAEIRYLRTIGADLVGMSTVPEVIVARHMGLEVLAISCVTNMAAGMSGEKISHDDVLETGERVARQVRSLAAGGLATHRAPPRISVCLTAHLLIRHQPLGLHWSRMSGKSYLIGIAGPSGAGKSYLAHHLADRLQAPVLALDHYYRDLSHLPPEERERCNFDDPAALEDELLIAHAQQLQEGRPVEIPTYDFSTHTRSGETQLFRPATICHRRRTVHPVLARAATASRHAGLCRHGRRHLPAASPGARCA